MQNKDLNILESEINSELAKVHIWLSVNKLSLILKIQILLFFIQDKNEFPKRSSYLI